jgi:hypothetical protein
MGQNRDGSRVLVRKAERKRKLGRPSVDGRIILQYILEK